MRRHGALLDEITILPDWAIDLEQAARSIDDYLLYGYSLQATQITAQLALTPSHDPFTIGGLLDGIHAEDSLILQTLFRPLSSSPLPNEIANLIHLPTVSTLPVTDTRPTTLASSFTPHGFKRRRTHATMQDRGFSAGVSFPGEPCQTTQLRIMVAKWLEEHPDSTSTSFVDLNYTQPGECPENNFILALCRISSDGRWGCYACEFKTDRGDRAEAHIRMHFHHKPYHCGGGDDACGRLDCQARFTSKKDLATHRTEIKKGKVTCEYCGGAKSAKNVLRHQTKCRSKYASGRKVDNLSYPEQHGVSQSPPLRSNSSLANSRKRKRDD